MRFLPPSGKNFHPRAYELIHPGLEYCALAINVSGAAKTGVLAFSDNNSPSSFNYDSKL